jgi:hypothetical protein
MRAPLRSLLAVAIVLASAVGGAAYADNVTAHEPPTVTNRPVSTLDFSQIIANGDPDKRLIDSAFE